MSEYCFVVSFVRFIVTLHYSLRNRDFLLIGNAGSFFFLGGGGGGGIVCLFFALFLLFDLFCLFVVVVVCVVIGFFLLFVLFCCLFCLICWLVGWLVGWWVFFSRLKKKSGMAQLVKIPVEKPGTVNTEVGLIPRSGKGSFSYTESPFSADCLSMFVQHPCAVACINIKC